MRHSPLIVVAGIAMLIALGVVASCSRSVSEVGTGTYLNLDPQVQYVGREQCQSCHQEIYDSYLETGMGQSLYRPDSARAIEETGAGVVVHDPKSGYFYHPRWQGNDFYILEFRLSGKDTTYQRREKIDYVVGSGHQTRSYLLDRGGYMYEAPITWYVARKKWDMSPGYEDGHNSRFDRAVGEECMACHTGKIDYQPGSTNFYRQVSLGIDCEKCHGPGQEHVARMERDEIVDVGREIDYSIVNPAKLPIQAQFDVCMQCHLQGVNVLQPGHESVQEYRPGMSLSAVYDIFIEQHEGEADFGIASHAERLLESACFKGSAGKMTCTTCHDPHKSISVTATDTYTRQCQSCHQAGKGQSAMCSAPADLRSAAADNCITCHMRKAGVSDIPHVTFTDHRIRVLRDTSSADPGAIRKFLRLVAMTDSTPTPANEGAAYLAYFERHAPDPVFLATAARLLPADRLVERARLANFQGQYAQALTLIDQALAARPQDSWLQMQKAELLERTARPQEALALYRQVFQSQPYLTDAALKAGTLIIQTATDKDAAIRDARALFSAALAKKPQDEKLNANMGFLEMNAGNVQAASNYLSQALATHPDYLLALENMVLLQANFGSKEIARKYLARLLQAHPAYPKAESMSAMLAQP
jgi:Tfp pilus assembly protein PilF